MEDSVWSFWLWSIWLPLGNPEFLSAAPWSMPRRVGTLQWNVTYLNKAGQASKVLKVTPKTRSEGGQRAHQSCLGTGDGCASQGENSSGTQVPLSSPWEDQCLCHCWVNLSDLGEAAVDPPQCCVNKEHFDPNLMLSLWFYLSPVSHSRICW